MAFSRLPALPLALPLAGLVALRPEPAEACSPDPCASESFVSSLNVLSSSSLPADGVLLLRATGTNIGNEDILALLELEVTQNGQPIAGAVEDTGGFGLLAWRPAAPLVPGQVHQVHATLTNVADEDDYDYYQCGEDMFALEFEFMAEPGASQALGAPQVAAEDLLYDELDRGLDGLVCCDGAIPSDYDNCGYDDLPYWSMGECTQTAAHGFLRVTLDVETGVDDPLTREQLLIGVRVDGVLVLLDELTEKALVRDAPFCTQVEVHNVGTGEIVVAPEQCHGQADAAQLGPLKIDPHLELDGVCAGPLYTCAEDPSAFPPSWDPDKCEDWDEPVVTTGETPTTSDSASSDDADSSASGDTDDEGDDGEADSSGEGPGADDLVDHGCACTGAPADPGALLGLAGLGLLARRRRRSV